MQGTCACAKTCAWTHLCDDQYLCSVPKVWPVVDSRRRLMNWNPEEIGAQHWFHCALALSPPALFTTREATGLELLEFRVGDSAEAALSNVQWNHTSPRRLACFSGSHWFVLAYARSSVAISWEHRRNFGGGGVLRHCSAFIPSHNLRLTPRDQEGIEAGTPILYFRMSRNNASSRAKSISGICAIQQSTRHEQSDRRLWTVFFPLQLDPLYVGAECLPIASDRSRLTPISNFVPNAESIHARFAVIKPFIHSCLPWFPPKRISNCINSEGEKWFRQDQWQPEFASSQQKCFANIQIAKKVLGRYRHD